MSQRPCFHGYQEHKKSRGAQDLIPDIHTTSSQVGSRQCIYQLSLYYNKHSTQPFWSSEFSALIFNEQKVQYDKSGCLASQKVS